jgi:formylglycine-generating enzyme required for sulfatase activity
MAKTIFISYSTKDADGAQEVCRLLEERGISCWIAPRDVPPGADWAESIMDGIKDAIGFVLVLSEHVNTSRHCKSEVEVAFSAGKAVFPIRLRQIQPSASLHLFLSSSQWIDAWEPPLENHIDRLAGAVKRLQGEAVPDAPVAAPATKPSASRADVAKDVASKAATAAAPVAKSALSWATAKKNRKFVIAAALVLVAFVAFSMMGGDRGAATPAAKKAAERKAGDVATFDGMEFVWAPAGAFQMGSPASETGRGRDEQQHEVILTKGFWIGKTEVTKEQWSALMDKKPWQGYDKIPYAEKGPASNMTWVDANLFIQKLNKEQAGPYRLPTEAEWEYACRAGTTTAYSFGVHEGFQLQEYAWCAANTGGVKEPWAHAVGTRKPNNWGIHDMHGNLWEFCSDWTGGAYPFPDDGPVTDPKGPETGNARVLRGGAYDSRDYQLRSAQRHGQYVTRGYVTVGFRLVRDDVPVPAK